MVKEINLKRALDGNLPADPIFFVGLVCLGQEYPDVKVALGLPIHILGLR